jgi:hypothetical protein
MPLKTRLVPAACNLQIGHDRFSMFPNPLFTIPLSSIDVMLMNQITKPPELQISLLKNGFLAS